VPRVPRQEIELSRQLANTGIDQVGRQPDPARFSKKSVWNCSPDGFRAEQPAAVSPLAVRVEAMASGGEKFSPKT
jgi:hypothetical protein